MLKNGPFQNLTQVVASILVTSVTPQLEFCRVWRPCIEQSYIRTARSQHRQGVLLYLPIMSNQYATMFEHRFLPLKNDDSFRKPPPPQR